MHLKTFTNPSTLHTALSDHITDLLNQAIDRSGRASLVVPGGSTPITLFNQLSTVPLPWSKVLVTLSDERWVDDNHPDSNAKLVKSQLLINLASKAHFLPLNHSKSSVSEAAIAANKQLSSQPTFDITLLGMGSDGHTASLFPGSQALKSGLDLNNSNSSIAITPANSNHPRISLTLPRLLDSHQLILFFRGQAKHEVFLEAKQTDDIYRLPIAAIIKQDRTPLTAYWAP
ncbi:MAG: 6-phosphogluconolactonase [Gammaproteobacteria bacterium]|jgi:6-phosphogluconolactonase|nr:6-phosphogluconolactonase [Gammaproteobacteria bacterium]MBT5201996.1 6-phosphogluconolactonase [Gammaproteobacteria bacterium]MBT5603651.1 6-phosphogluconolactonase [Gammaproteobacteria bacterium]MBT6246452.1 6-phosphogluconolactonase [Gammaproteobacteria bacterium]